MKQYKAACEIKYYKFNFSLLLFFYILYLFLFLPLVFTSDAEDAKVPLLLLSMLFLPFTGYFGYKLWYYTTFVPTNVQTVKLEQVGSSIVVRNVHFIVEMNIEGNIKRLKTNSIFGIGHYGANLIDTYSMQEVLIGYDEKNQKAIVLEELKQ